MQVGKRSKKPCHVREQMFGVPLGDTRSLSLRAYDDDPPDGWPPVCAVIVFADDGVACWRKTDGGDVGGAVVTCPSRPCARLDSDVCDADCGSEPSLYTRLVSVCCFF